MLERYGSIAHNSSTENYEQAAREALSRVAPDQRASSRARAAIGALLPATERENRSMGEISDTAMAKAKETAAALYEKGRDAAKQSLPGQDTERDHHSDTTEARKDAHGNDFGCA